ncbi:Holliday junction resolvase RuvX [Paenibacillus dendritiformis]|uniref:Putative pre-16S rRNA nuclease n=1 Tax=Paenibacillus dendritiformis C454 TaxID=1131935 RepID=H3SG01_9BACL|nr:Holliday junction resolvase RuvX [Paenibacillus dendritiformis]EHQ61964.1 Holliday junction resolvase YqgF [Paenibacillus dendritiformis C454]PZM62548.1 Holliday junction resolvase RuvX [Paenibacillus dendritiformis]TDL55457.1 Holliday junction resolvase RuvX [Paenibacillus dendritiformis]WGU97298.1 Holliday junction resolvase RuvX [Paenibacillus dendritiformis]CAH8769472.1 Holliday junction resolvase RuvX [Paenibacillus dendritiformis]
MKILGLDYGDRKIGVAVSDAFGWTAQGLEVIVRRKPEDDLRRIGDIIKEHGVEEIVIGLPKNMNGTIGPRGEISMSYAEVLKQSFGLPVHLWDERLSTVSAERALLEADVSRKKRRQVIDKMAATIILQTYLDYQSRR